MAISFPTFYGHHDENARDFMDSLEMAHLMVGRDQEEVKLRAFPLVLKGEARVWYDTLAPPSKATWPILYGAFLNKYGQGNTPENLWKQLLQHRQGSLGDYNTYESKFTNLWERWAASLQGQGGAPNFLKRDKFVEGMFPTLKEKVEAKFPQTFEEAQEIATVKFKKLLYQERKSNSVKEREEVNVPQHTNNAQPRVASVSADSHQEDLLHKLTQQLETLTLNLVQAPTRGQQPRDDARPLRRSTQELRCWNCNETGHGTELRMCTAFHPQTDGETERVNRILEDMLRMMTLRMTPFEAIYGYNCPTPINFLNSKNKVELSREMLEKMDSELAKIRGNIREAQKRHKLYYDKKHRVVEYETGDMVFLKDNSKLKDDGTLIVEPDLVLDRRVKHLRNRDIVEVLIKWQNYPVEDASWVDLSVLQREFPSFQL
ncbi:hypothetical protein L7F22_046231 [Adiantum nelumboides]|nr:hypothetical protein [Adiantum nelumboides]